MLICPFNCILVLACMVKWGEATSANGSGGATCPLSSHSRKPPGAPMYFLAKSSSLVWKRDRTESDYYISADAKLEGGLGSTLLLRSSSASGSAKKIKYPKTEKPMAAWIWESMWRRAGSVIPNPGAE